MKDCLNSSVDLYQNVCTTATGKEATLKKVVTPCVDEDQTLTKAKMPFTGGPCVLCEWCGHTYPNSDDCKYHMYDAVKKKHAAAKTQSLGSGCEYTTGSGGESETEDTEVVDKDTLHQAASAVLMKTRYAARTAIPDLLRPTLRLASYVTKWTPYRNMKLHHLDCYIWSTIDYMQESYVAHIVVATMQCVASYDSDVAGCVDTMRPTTGGHICLEGPSSHLPIHARSKRQDSTASSTPEAAIVAADTVVRTMRIP